MNNEALTQRLHEMEEHWKKQRFWRAAGYTLVLFLLALTLAALIDYLIPLSFGQRMVLSLSVYGSVLAYAWFGWWRPYRMPLSPRRVAWLLEAAVPEFEEKLISAVELQDVDNEHVSTTMIHSVLEDAELDLSKVEPRGVFPINWRLFLIPALVLALFFGALLAPSFNFGRMVARVALPSDKQATIGAFRLAVVSPGATTIAEEDAATFLVKSSDSTLRKVDLCVEEDGKVKRYPMAWDPSQKQFTHSLPDLRRSFRYWAQSGRVLSQKYDLVVLRRPKVESFIIVTTMPPYTGLPNPSAEDTTSGSLEGYAGTRIGMTVVASKPLESLSMDWLGETREVALARDGMLGTIDLELTESGTWRLYLKDRDGLFNAKDISYTVTVLQDQLPTVTLLEPKGEVHLGMDDTLPILWQADDDFGISAQALVYQVRGRDAARRELPLTTNGLNWVMSESGLQDGDEVDYHIEVADAKGQVAISTTRYLSMVKGVRLTQANAFLGTVGELLSEVDSMKKRLAQSGVLAERMRTASGGEAVENADHYRNMMSGHTKALALRLKRSEVLASELKANASFIPRGILSSDLMQRYFRQERLFSRVEMLQPATAGASVSELKTLRELTGDLSKALEIRAGQLVPVLQVSRMQKTARALEGSKAKDLTQRLAARAKEIALTHKKDYASRFDSTKQLTTHLGQLAQALDQQASDYRQIDDLNRKIRDRLRSRDEQIAELARQLELFNKDADWEAVAAMEEVLRAEAELATDPDEKADLAQAADVMQEALESQDASKLEGLEEQMAAMERANELAALKEQLDEARAQTDDLLAQLREELEKGMPLQTSEDTMDAMERVQALMDLLKETPLGDVAMTDDPQARSLAEELRIADEHLNALEAALDQQDLAKANTEMNNMESRLDLAEDKLADLDEKASNQAELARDTLDTLLPTASEELAALREQLSPMLDDASATPDPASLPPTPAELAQELSQAEQELVSLSEALKADARREIADDEGDIAEARNQMALAEAIDDVQIEHFQPAMQALQQAETPEEIAAARQALAQALEELDDSRALMEQFEQGERLELSSAERAEVEAALAQLAAEQLDPQLLDTLDHLEQLRDNTAQAEALADQAQQLAEQPTPTRAQELSEATEALRQELAQALMNKGRDAFMDEAEDTIQDARQLTEDLLTDARAMRAALREPEAIEDPAMRKQLLAEAEGLKEQAAELGIELARADAVKDLLDPPGAHQTALEDFENETRPLLEQVAQQVEAQQDPSQPLDAAIDDLKEVADSLNDVSDDLAHNRIPSPQTLATKETESPEISPWQLADLGRRLDAADNALSEAIGADRAAEAASERLLEQEQKALKALAELPEAALSDWAAKEKEQVEANLEKGTDPWAPVQALEKASNWMNEVDRDAAKELKDEAREMRKLVENTNPVELERRAQDRARAAANDAEGLQNELAKIDDPLAEAASEALEQMQANLSNEEFDRAEANLDAARADITALATPEAATPDLAFEAPIAEPAPAEPMQPQELAAQNPAFQKAADPGQDMLTRKGLSKTANDALDLPPEVNPVAAAELAADDELAAAADLARGDAALDFAEAAGIEAAMAEAPMAAADDSETETPAAFTAPRTPLTAAAEAALAQQAAEDRAGLIEDALAKVEEARALADADPGAAQAQDQAEALAEAVQEADAMRAALGERDFDAQQTLAEPDADPAAAMKQAGEQLADYEAALKAEQDKQAAFDKLAQASSELEAAAAQAAAYPEAAKQAADALANQLEPRKGLASQQAADAVDALKEALAAPDSSPAAVEEAAADVAEAIALLDPAAPPPTVLNEEAFDAAARAAALDNQDALEDALAGDFAAAAESMKALAEALPDGARKEQAAQAAQEFAAAREAQMEELPASLAEAIEAAEASESTLPGLAADALAEATDAARAGALPQASEALQDALAAASPDAKPALEQLDEQIRAAAAAEAAQIASLPEPVQAALEAIQDLASTPDPVSRAALAEAAKAVMDQDFADAADALTEAAFTLPPEAASASAELASALDQVNDETFGTMSDAAKDALAQMKQPDEAVAAAAREEDYAGAAELAKSANSPEAAKAFEAAADQQVAALPNSAKEALAQLDAAQQKAPAGSHQQTLLNEAEKAARRGDLLEASALANEAAQQQGAQFDVAEALEQAADLAAAMDPLQKAAEAAGQNRFGQAALQAAQSPFGEEAMHALAAAEEATQQSIEQAYADALSGEKKDRDRLENMANHLKNNDISQAMNQARGAHNMDPKTKQALDALAQAVKTADAAIKKAMNEAGEAEAATQAQNALSAAKQAATQSVQASQKAEQAARQQEQALNRAEQSMNTNPALAAKQLAQAGQDPLAEQVKALGDQPAPAQMQQVREALQAAKSDAREAVRSAQAQTQAARQQGNVLNQAQQALQQKQPARAAELARNASNGAMEARDAAHSLAEAAQEMQSAANAVAQTAQAASPPGSEPGSQSGAPQPGQAGTSPGQMTPPSGQDSPAAAASSAPQLAQAMIDLQAAQSALAQPAGQGSASQPGESLEQAAASLNEAAKNMAAAALEQMGQPPGSAESAAQTAAAQQAGDPSGQEPGASADGSSPGGEEGNTAKGAQGDPASISGDLGDSWRGVKDGLRANDKQGRKQQYNEFYRNANREYLESLLKERR